MFDDVEFYLKKKKERSTALKVTRYIIKCFLELRENDVITARSFLINLYLRGILTLIIVWGTEMKIFIYK